MTDTTSYDQIRWNRLETLATGDKRLAYAMAEASSWAESLFLKQELQQLRQQATDGSAGAQAQSPNTRLAAAQVVDS